jgi:hypothetical protein
MAAAGSWHIWLAEPIGRAWALRLGGADHEPRETKGIAPEQQFPSREIRLRGPLRRSYAAGEPVEPVTEWAEWMRK